jgi:cytochrome d ubiquinol oxidase subunit I
MDSALAVHRLHFAFTITYHYLFPQLTMGLALLILIFKSMALKTGQARYDQAARFWGRIFAVNFVMGVVTGIPMEFQFGTNWARFAKAAGGVVGQTLAMEGMFSFFLEASFLGLFVYAEKRLGPRGHWAVAALIFAGTWLSGFFICATNAWMQHPVGHRVGPDGTVHLASLGAVFTNPWLGWQYAHTMVGSVVTAAFAMSSVGAYYLLARQHEEHGRLFVQTGVIAGFVACILAAFPTGDGQAQMVAKHQPVTLAAMEGLFKTQKGAPIVLIGQPDMENLRLDNPIHLPRALSFVTHHRWGAEVKGLDAFPREEWPQNIPLLYYSYHVMLGLGTLLMLASGIAAAMLWKGRLLRARWMLWALMLLLPFPYIANTAGWLTAELGRQPWVIHGVMRTSAGFSENVSAGNALYTLIGFMAMYAVLSVLFLFVTAKIVAKGPSFAEAAH